MDALLFEGETSEKIDYSETDLSNHEFLKCHFIACHFSKCDLSNIDFIDCTFTSCDLSLVNLDNATLDNISFSKCKLVGINFGAVNTLLFSVNFNLSHLDYSFFSNVKMKKTKFIDCTLKEVEFNHTDLTLATFKNCDLIGSTFVNTTLEKADFRTSKNISFDPDFNKMKKAKFSNQELAGLLTKYNLDIEY